MSGNDIVLLDPSASRYHAKIELDESRDCLILHDLGSTNGTFVNRERITAPRELQANDVVRIGQHLIEFTRWEETTPTKRNFQTVDTHHLTRDLVLQSLDHHAILLAEVASHLNTVMDLDTALKEVSNLMKSSMGADRCEVILADKFDKLSDLGFAKTIAQQAIEQRSAVVHQDAQSNPALGKSAFLLRIHAAMCVPVISGNEVLALIYVFKNRSQAKPFDQRDLQLAVAISHQAALTIQRMQLLQRVRREELVSKLLQRFLSPQEAKYLFKEYLESGKLPPITEHKLTILAADICDSTGLAERLGSRRFSKVLSGYYEQMSEAVFKHGGMLNKYMGDGLMAVFGLPEQPPNPEERALLTAIEMIQSLHQYNRKIGEEINIGIGINTGPAIAGYMGTAEYIEFTVIGYPVNIAWGLESHARPNRILIGHPTFQTIANKFHILALGPLELKRDAEPVLAYEVLGAANA